MKITIAFLTVLAAASLAPAQTKRTTTTKQTKDTALKPPTPADVKELTDRIDMLAEAAARAGSPVELSPTAKEASKVSSKWLDAANIPQEGKDGRVVYRFGAGMPVLVCAPLHVCVIELEPGEKTTDAPVMGDTVRWEITPLSSGQDPAMTTMLAVKPLASNLETDVVISTNRRAYLLRLVSDTERMTARVGFSYPDTEAGVWRAHVTREREEIKQAELKQAEQAEQEAARTAAKLAPPEKQNFGYESKMKKGKANYIKPTRVYDNGAKTFIVMSAAIEHQEAPVLMIDVAGGKPEAVNYRVSDNVYVVDRLFDHARLVLGTGKTESTVEISRIKNGA